MEDAWTTQKHTHFFYTCVYNTKILQLHSDGMYEPYEWLYAYNIAIIVTCNTVGITVSVHMYKLSNCY